METIISTRKHPFYLKRMPQLDLNRLANAGGRDYSFLVDEKRKFRVMDAKTVGKLRYTNDIIYARYNTEIGKDNQIPLWLFGFLY